MNRKILIVEDEKDILNMLSEAFRFEGYEVLCSSDGEEALRIIRIENPDIILLDLQIPKVNGFQVCNSIKSNPILSPMKVIIISGKAQQIDREIAQDAGADDYITKPFSIIKLVEMAEALLNSDKEI